jgi:hypothetical protein
MSIAEIHPVRPSFKGDGIYRVLKKGKLPLDTIHSLLHASKRLADGGEIARRRRLFETEVRAPARPMPRETGYLRFTPEDFPAIGDAVARARAVYEAKRAAEDESAFLTNPRKNFLLRIFSGAEFMQYPEIVRFIADRRLLDTVATYLGSVPIMTIAELWWSPPNDSKRSSQLVHTDYEDRRQVKCFLNVSDVDEDQGPFTFFPRDVSIRLRERLPKRGTRFTDEAIAAAATGEEPVRLTGPAGHGALVDSSSCLHFGSRGNRRDRVVLMVQFLRFDAPCATFDTLWARAPDGRVGDIDVADLDPVQRAVFGYR